MAHATQPRTDGGTNPFTDLLTPSARVKILAVLISTDQALAPGTITEQAGIDRTSWYNHVDDLLEWGVIEEDRKVGNSMTYKADHDNPLVQALEATLDFAAATQRGDLNHELDLAVDTNTE